MVDLHDTWVGMKEEEEKKKEEEEKSCQKS